MTHLSENNTTYIKHLRRAWGVAFVLLVHGLFPNKWQDKASDMLCSAEDQKT